MIGNKVLGWGRVPNQFMVVGEGPGRNESVEGIPFVGASGAELDYLFLPRAAQMQRSDFYITNIVKWRTDEEDSDPSKEDIERDEPELLAEIEVVNPRIIVSVGRVATAWFMQTPDVDMEREHGVPTWCPRYPDKILIPTYHPAAGIRLPERYYDKIYWDYQRVGRVVRGEIAPHPPEKTVYYRKVGINEAPFYSKLSIVGVDTEGSADHPWGLSISASECNAIVHTDDKGPTKEVLKEILRGKVVLHNALHDIRVLERMGYYCGSIEDTMLMAYLLPHLPRGLKALAYKLTGMGMESYEEIIADAEKAITKEYYERILSKKCPTCGGDGEVSVPYKRQPTKFKRIKCDTCKGDGTSWPLPEAQLVFDSDYSGRVYKPRSIGRRVREALERGTDLRAAWESLDVQTRSHVEGELGQLREPTLDDVDTAKAVHYSARDADATLRVYNVLAPIIKKEGLQRVYDIDKGIIPIIDRMHTNGILIDIPYFEYLNETFKQEQEGIRERLCALAGSTINPSSPIQVSNLLYGKFGLKAYRGTTSTDEKTLEALKIRYSDREDVAEAIFLINEDRELTKLCGTYVEPLPLAADRHGRVHTQFLLHVTSSGRLSSRNPNLQNIPTRTDRGKLIRRGFIAKEGCVLVSVDLDQIELRVAAHLSEDDNMVDIFRTGKDIHRATASLIYGKPLEEITTQERLLSKTINFGILYGMSAKRLHKELGLLGINVTLDDCIRFIYDWFKAYPGIRDYMDRCHAQAKSLGYVECLFGRRRYLPGVHSTIDKIREESLRWAVNHPDQGTAAALLKIWMSNCWSRVLPRVARFGYCEPLLTVHDELIFEVEKGLEELLMPLVIEEAAQTANLLVPISAKGGYGAAWSDLK